MRAFLKVIGIFFLALTVVACSEYQKALKSTDISKKKELAEQLYDKKEYNKAYLLIDDIYPLIRTSRDGEKFGFMYAMCEHKIGNNILASYKFKSIYDQFPTGNFAEESLYMFAYCLYLEAPNVEFDQASSIQAMEAFQLFINRFPESKRIEDCNKYIDEILEKDEIKSFNTARLYYKIEDYRAALWTFKNFLEKYPLTEKRSETEYMLLDAYYKLALNSVESKRKERFEDAVAFYTENKAAFEKSKYAPQALSIYKNSLSRINQKK